MEGRTLTLCPSKVPIQSPVLALRSIGCLSRHALKRKTPSTVSGENCSSTIARLWPGHTIGICLTKSTPALAPPEAATTYAFSVRQCGESSSRRAHGDAGRTCGTHCKRVSLFPPLVRRAIARSDPRCPGRYGYCQDLYQVASYRAAAVPTSR